MQRSEKVIGASRRQALTAGLALPLAAGGAWAASGATNAAQAQASGGHNTVQPSSVIPQPPVMAPLKAFISGAATSVIDEETRELGRRHILDTLASAVACRDLEPSVVARNYALEMSGDVRAGAVTILGTRQTASLVDAVFAGAMTAHGAEINDFIPSAYVQPGPAVVATAIGVAERNKARGAPVSGDAFLKAVLIGYELSGRIPKALGIHNLQAMNLANHGIGPVFGSAATAASLLGLTSDEVGHMLSYCGQQASGCWQWMLDVEHIEKSFVFAGMGARNGLQAAVMAKGGFHGVRDAFDQPSGWLNAPPFRGNDGDRAYLITDLGTRWEMPHTAFKRYPVGGPTQPAIEGLLTLLPQINRGEVKRVLIEMPGRADAFRDAEMPALNLRYLTAIILLDGRLDFVSAQSLERMHGDAAVAAIMSRVEVVHDEAQETPRGLPREESARVTIDDAGSPHTVFVPFVRGFPSHPMDRADVEAKALELMGPLLGADRANAVIRQVRDLDSMTDASRLAELIAVAS